MALRRLPGLDVPVAANRDDRDTGGSWRGG